MKNLETENLRNRRMIKNHSFFLDVVVTIISIISSMNGIVNIFEGWFDPLGEMGAVFFGLTVVQVVGGVLGLAVGLGIGLLFKTLSESLGLTTSDNKKSLVVGSLIMLGVVDTMLIAYGQYAGYVKVEEHRAEILNREKMQVKVEAYKSAKENVALVKAQIDALQKELLGDGKQNAAATAEIQKQKLLKAKIKEIKKRFNVKRKVYAKDDAKNQNWINVQEQKEINRAKKEMKVVDPVTASMQYKDKLQKKIEALIEQKKHYLEEQQKASDEIKRVNPKLTDWWIVALGSLLSALGFTYFSFKINKLKGAAKTDYETGLKTLQTKKRRESEVKEGGEEMSPLMQRLQKMKEKGETAFTDVVGGEAEATLSEEAQFDMDEMMLEKIFRVSAQIGEYDDGDLQKASLEDLRMNGLDISDYTHRKVIAYGVESGKLFQKVPRGAYYFKRAA